MRLPWRTLLTAAAAALLSVPAAALQDPGAESFPSAPRGPEPRPEEVAARDAWLALQESIPGPEDRSRAAFERYLRRLVAAFEDFAAENPATAASFEARHELALMEIHALRRIEAGVARLERILVDSRSWKGPAPEGLRLDVPNYVFVVALALADLERFARAEELLEPVTEEDGPRAEQAERLLQRVRARKKLQVGLPMPNFQGPRLRDGGVWRLEDFRGKVVLIQFWATWCRPCAQEMPQIATLHQELGGAEFAVLGITLDDERREGRTRVQGYCEDIGLTAPQIYEGVAWDGKLVEQFALRAIPANFLLDRDGVIRARNLRGDELRAAVEVLLSAADEPEKSQDD